MANDGGKWESFDLRYEGYKPSWDKLLPTELKKTFKDESFRSQVDLLFAAIGLLFAIIAPIVGLCYNAEIINVLSFMFGLFGVVAAFAEIFIPSIPMRLF